jgi:hypothetical protein
VKNVHFEKGSLLDYNGAGLVNEAFCEGCPEAVVHRIATSVDDTPLNYVLDAKQKEIADSAATETAEVPPTPKAPWEGRKISHEEPVPLPAPESRQIQAARKLSAAEPKALPPASAPPISPPGVGRLLPPAPASERRSSPAQSTQAAREVASSPAPLSASRLAPETVLAAPLKAERLPTVEP